MSTESQSIESRKSNQRESRTLIHARRLLPVAVIVVATVGLLLPMGLAFRNNEPLAGSVDDLQLQWLRFSLTIEQVAPDDLQAFSAMLEQAHLRELSRFSPRLAEALEQLPVAVTAVEQAVRAERAVPMPQILAVDELLAAVREEAEALDEQQSAAYSGLLTFIMIAAAGFAVLWAYQTARVGRLTAEAVESRRLSELERRVRDQERGKLARELHDGAAQELAVAGIAVDLMDKDRSFEHLPTLSESIRSALDEIRLVYRAMNPRISRASELPEMVRELAVGIEQRSGQHFDVSFDSLASVSWRSEALLHVFRIAQECMHNVVRHAHADWASVSIRTASGQSGAQVVLRVEDNGVGIRESEEGYGRCGVRERVELLHGTVAWHNRESGGTLVEVMLPADEDMVRLV